MELSSLLSSGDIYKKRKTMINLQTFESFINEASSRYDGKSELKPGTILKQGRFGQFKLEVIQDLGDEIEIKNITKNYRQDPFKRPKMDYKGSMIEESKEFESIVFEGKMKEIFTMAQESSNYDAFKKEVLKAHPTLKQDSNLDEWLKEIFNNAQEAMDESSDEKKHEKYWNALNPGEKASVLSILYDRDYSPTGKKWNELSPETRKKIISDNFFDLNESQIKMLGEGRMKDLYIIAQENDNYDDFRSEVFKTHPTLRKDPSINDWLEELYDQAREEMSEGKMDLNKTIKASNKDYTWIYQTGKDSKDTAVEISKKLNGLGIKSFVSKTTGDTVAIPTKDLKKAFDEVLSGYDNLKQFAYEDGTKIDKNLVNEGSGSDVGDKVYFRGDYADKYPATKGYYGIIDDVVPARNYNMMAVYTVNVYDKKDNEIGTIRVDWGSLTTKR